MGVITGMDKVTARKIDADINDGLDAAFNEEISRPDATADSLLQRVNGYLFIKSKELFGKFGLRMSWEIEEMSQPRIAMRAGIPAPHPQVPDHLPRLNVHVQMK